MHPEGNPDRGGADGRASHILDAAASLFAERGVDHTSMREIAERVGINVGGLYYYFTSKNLLLSTVLSDFLERLLQRYDRAIADIDDPCRRLREIVLVSFETAIAQPDATKVYQSESRIRRDGPAFDRIRDLSVQAQRRWMDAIERGQESGALRSDVPARIFHRFLRDAVWLSAYWHDAGSTHSPEQLTDHCIAVFLHGMSSPGDSAR